jgi:hypothetical protein
VNFVLSGAPTEAQPSESAANGSFSNNGAAGLPLGQGSDLKADTTCDLGPEAQIVQADGPVKDFAWPTPTKDGEVRIPVEVGYRALVTYEVQEPFGNLKVERLPRSQYSHEKATLL